MFSILFHIRERTFLSVFFVKKNLRVLELFPKNRVILPLHLFWKKMNRRIVHTFQNHTLQSLPLTSILIEFFLRTFRTLTFSGYVGSPFRCLQFHISWSHGTRTRHWYQDTAIISNHLFSVQFSLIQFPQ